MRKDEKRRERAALYGSIGVATGMILGTTLLSVLGPAALAGGAILGATAGIVVELMWNRNESQ